MEVYTTPNESSVPFGGLAHHFGGSAGNSHERLRELTAILASGIHRLRQSPPTGPKSGQIPAESSPIGLDLGAQTRPDGAVLTPRENGDR